MFKLVHPFSLLFDKFLAIISLLRHYDLCSNLSVRFHCSVTNSLQHYLSLGTMIHVQTCPPIFIALRKIPCDIPLPQDLELKVLASRRPAKNKVLVLYIAVVNMLDGCYANLSRYITSLGMRNFFYIHT